MPPHPHVPYPRTHETIYPCPPPHTHRFDEVPLSAIVEYRFADAPWMLGSVTEETLAYYVSSKFKIWLELLMYS